MRLTICKAPQRYKISPTLIQVSVWSQVVSSLANVRSIFSDNETIAKGLRDFTLQLVSPAAEKVGWEFAPKEDFLTGQLRSLLISTAGGAGHQG